MQIEDETIAPTFPALSRRYTFAVFFLTVVLDASYTVWNFHVGADANYDLLFYHYYLGWAFITGHVFRDLFAAVGSFINPLESLPQYLILATLPPKVAAIVINTILSLLFPMLVYLARRVYFLSNSDYFTAAPKSLNLYAIATAIVGSLTPTVVSQIGGTMGDALWALPLVGASCALADFMVGHRRSSRIAMVGVLLGFAFAGKMTAGPFAIMIFALALVVIIFTGGATRRLGAAVLFLSTAASFLFFDGYWAFYLWQRFRDPLFPFLGPLFGSPYSGVNSLKGDPRFLPHGVLQAIVYPYEWIKSPQLVSEVPFRDLAFLVSYATIVAGCLVGVVVVLAVRQRRRWYVTRILMVGIPFLGSYLLWASLWGIYRYLVFLCLIAPILGMVILLTVFGSGLLRRRLVSSIIFLWLAVLSYGALKVIPANFGRVAFTKHYFTVSPALNARGRDVVIVDPSSTFEFALPFIGDSGSFIRVTYGSFDGNAAAVVDRLTGLRRGQSIEVLGSSTGGGVKEMRAALAAVGAQNGIAMVLDGSACHTAGAWVGNSKYTTLIMCKGAVVHGNGS